MDVDILKIDQKIRSNYEEELAKRDVYTKRIEYFKKLLSNSDNDNKLSISLRNRIQEELHTLEEKMSDNTYQYYILDTSGIMEEYKDMLSRPKKIVFFGKVEKDENKTLLIEKYIESASKYIDLSEYKNKKESTVDWKFKCDICKEQKEYKIVDKYTYICETCGSHSDMFGNAVSYKDSARINISSKYMYERQVHFRDCINQYQGKQNSNIHPDIIENLKKQFIQHGIVSKEEAERSDFSKVTKEYILLFLKELDYTKQYENVFLIHYKLTGKQPDDISHLEEKLLSDFDTLSILYDQKFKHTRRINRKNFINAQYVLYQLLRKHKHKCKKEDFNILKTLDRQNFYDEICGELFTELGWNFTPFF